MGLGIGKCCERCGNQICYGDKPFTLKEEGEKYDLCGDCVKIMEFDEKLKKENQ